ncbi:MAG: hypothetical protein C0501_20850 [Isosphaera sp.]|nr:hypothetical protein [Isosphaera sp.]
MATVQLKLGPADHGRSLTLDDFDGAEFEPGHRYEIIDGMVYVSPLANFPENFLETWLYDVLRDYSRAHPEVINYVSTKTRVFVPRRRKATVPEPDIAAYADFPRERPAREIRWQDINPVLVCEVLVEGDARKDLTRNPDLYLATPSVKEYWVLDGRDNADEPTLVQHRRYGKRWVVRSFPYGSTFTTRLLPGFTLPVDPRK